jgi:hypothetical protein
MRITKPNRVTRTYTQRLVAGPSKVFPLLCPVREADWLDGWDPLVVLSQSGAAEPDCVFLTKAGPSEAIWYITKHEPGHGLVEMIKITPAVTACKLTIQLRPVGDAFVAAFTEEHYRQFMRDWEARINHYLSHGSILRKTAVS